MDMKSGSAVRISHLTIGGHGSRTLAAAEAHGKRLDATSQMRKVADIAPRVDGGLDLQALYAAHAAGCQMDKRTRAPVLHALLQWPTDLQMSAKTELGMMKHSKRFLTQLFGEEAVFAMRLDRDERGKHAVDAFLAPITTKTSARGKVSRWIQPTAALKALCARHSDEILRRYPTIKPENMNSPRCQGIALQSEWRNYLLNELELRLPEKRAKRSAKPDRLSPEEYALKAREAALAKREAHAEAQLNHANELIGQLHDRQQAGEIIEAASEVYPMPSPKP